MAKGSWRGKRAPKAGLAAGIILAGLVAVVFVVVSSGSLSPVGARSTPTIAPSGPAASAGSSPAASATPPLASAAPTTPPVILVPAPLTGMLVSPEAALRHPIAVMIDDHEGARPQSGFNSAAIVLQAPAEGGIPRYMLVFQDTVPAAVGPIRSARQYFIEWAGGWDAMYVHHGGSPQALQTLRTEGRGQLVWNADGFRWLGTYLWRNLDRPAPHNVYTDGAHLRALARRLGVRDQPIDPAWTFQASDDAAPALGNTIKVVYPYESITFRYDPNRDAYLRYINGSKKAQVDAADGKVVAPANVVVIRMHFGPLSDSDPHHRLEAADIGHGDAWISTGGRTIHGTWRKTAADAPLLLLDAKGKPVVLTPGQTFIEVLPLTYGYSIRNGAVPPPGRDLDGPLAPT